MMINESNLDAIRVGFDAALMDAFDSADQQLLYVNTLAMLRTSTTKKTRFGVMARVPKMREWNGSRVMNNITEYTHELTAKDYEDSIEVDANAIREDNLGIYGDVLAALGSQARKHPDDLLVTLLQNGHLSTATCYDGQNFFDTDHPIVKGSSGSQQNYWSSGKPLTLDNVMSIRATMAAYKGDDSRPLGVRPNLIVVPPALEHVAIQISKAATIANTAGATPAAGTAGVDNVVRGMFDVMMMPELAGSDTTWYLVDATKRVRPIVVVENEGLVTDMLGPGSEQYFHTKKIQYGVSWRGTAGYGAWFLAAKMVG